MMLTLTSFTTKEEREKIIIKLYQEAFPDVARYIKKMGGKLEETEDIFQDALIIFYEKFGHEKSAIHNHKAYVVGISKYLWIKKYRKDLKMLSLEIYSDMAEALDKPDKIPSKETLIKYLEAAGKKCMEMLQSFYYQKLSLPEIAMQFGFSGVRSATVQKYKCLEKIRDVIKDKSLNYEDFLE